MNGQICTYDCGREPSEDNREAIFEEAIYLKFRMDMGFPDISITRLRELAKAEQESKAIVLPCKIGSVVKHVDGKEKQKVDAITIYADGRMTLCFHEVYKQEVLKDEWSESEYQNYEVISDDD